MGLKIQPNQDIFELAGKLSLEQSHKSAPQRYFNQEF